MITGQSHCEITDPEFFSFLFEKDQGSGRAVELLLQGKNSTGIRKFIRGLILMIDLAWSGVESRYRVSEYCLPTLAHLTDGVQTCYLQKLLSMTANPTHHSIFTSSALLSLSQFQTR